MRSLNRFLLKLYGACALFVFMSHGVQAQSDTSIFFKHATAFDQLLPSQIFPFDRYLPDSVSTAVYNVQPKGISLEKIIAFEQQTERTESVERIEDQKYTWDAEGRLIRYSIHRPDDTVPMTRTGINYIAGNKVSFVLRVDPLNSWKYDSLMIRYNRSGWAGNWRYSSKSLDSTYVENGTRMYDGKGRVIVATNANYGPLKGSYTYEYDANGQLIRRSFLAGSSGVILCTDTLEYKYLTDSRSILQVSHKLKVAGMANWVELERKTIYPYSGKIISYTDYNDADSNYFYRNYPTYTLRYEYDTAGRISNEYFGTTASPDLIRAQYYYGKFNQPDSIVYEELIEEKKKPKYYRIYSRDVREYDDKTGRISSRSITTYLFEEQKKNDKILPRETVLITYRWL